MNYKLMEAMNRTGWFKKTGVYTLFDGQYGSTGKGLLASVLMDSLSSMIDTITTNAGPNSGHTAYLRDYTGFEHKVVTRQLPIASVAYAMQSVSHVCYLNAGAVIDPLVLIQELELYKDFYKKSKSTIYIHPHAAMIDTNMLGNVENGAAHVASTGKGVGPAMINKLSRNEAAVYKNSWVRSELEEVHGVIMGVPNRFTEINAGVTFCEVAQGWSLGLNSGFYPYVTTRECGVSQALSDAGVSPHRHVKSIVSLRTYPIRVGNTAFGNSGPCYPDQEEILFSDLGVPPEVTTVTGRVRRIFTWSETQYKEMLRANEPDAIFVNFCNYLKKDEVHDFIEKKVLLPYMWMFDKKPDFILTGYGPKIQDVELWDS